MNVQTSSPFLTAIATETSVEIFLPDRNRISVYLDNGVDEDGKEGVHKNVFFNATSTGRTSAKNIPLMIAAYAEAARFAAVLASAIGREAYHGKSQVDRFDVRALLVEAAEVG